MQEHLPQAVEEKLGDKAAAVTARSETYPESEYHQAVSLAEQIGIRHLSIETEELAISAFRRNPPDRCYYCKRELFEKLRNIADELGLRTLVDGANADDVSDFRPGLRAAAELGVRSPLKEAGFTKEEIRLASRALGLTNWDKPAYACLSSRFPYGEPVTAEGVQRVEAAERFLRSFGLSQLRVRHHGDTARIEVLPDEIARLAAPPVRDRVVARLKELGFTYVTLDLQGFRSGSMNEVLFSRGGHSRKG